MSLAQSVLSLGLALLAGLVAACSEDDARQDLAGATQETLEISWPDLLPASERATLDAMRSGAGSAEDLAEYSSSSRDYQTGSFRTVERLDGRRVRMPGFLLPLDVTQRGQANAFLLLPYHGACVHYPAPPPNQIVYVTSIEPVAFDALWDPVWVEGVLQIDRRATELAETAYSMTVESVSDYAPEPS